MYSYGGVRRPLAISAISGPIVPVPDDRCENGAWWGDNSQGEPKYSEINLPQCNFVHHKSLMDCPGSEPKLPCLVAGV
jgi:hypothetical protein